ncbi:MAG: PSD1 and planctomycete cytochrome C domain-containing protein [Gemmataceae bacterium]
MHLASRPLARWLYFLLFALLSAPVSFAAERVDYERTIKPLLAARCYACHGALKQEGGLRLDTVALAKQGGDNGPSLQPGKPDESLLVAHVRGKGKRRMPPAHEGEALHADEIAHLEQWIRQGAEGPADEQPEPDPKEHWAFRPPVRSQLPELCDLAFGQNPIDRFVRAAQEARGLTPVAPADRALLLRRVSLDLIGLPPSAEETAAFLADSRPDAYERVVERLLASPHYGERWGRHWLDIWRYSDWWGLGAEVRNSSKHLYHWRDWTIESLNADLGYDEMLRQMLAADELYPADQSKLRATGYLVRSYFRFNRNTWLEEVVEHTAKGMLGLTMNCAKCHDHKYDPIEQVDFYRFRAFFEPYQIRMEMTPNEPDFEKNGIPRVYDCNPERDTYLFIRGDEKNPRKKPISPGLPALFGAKLAIRQVTLPAEAAKPHLREEVVQAYLYQANKQIQAARQQYKQAQAQGDATALAVASKTLLVAQLQPAWIHAVTAAERAKETTAYPEAARAAYQTEQAISVARAELALAQAEAELAKADNKTRSAAEKKRAGAQAALAAAKKKADTPGTSYTPLRGALKTQESNVETDATRFKPFPNSSTGRRTALAAWITDRTNPLTARVAVNHIWMRHFGTPLVATVFDFGRKGASPTHPELLDWLAVEFMESGWSMKHLHRLMVTSQTYRLASTTRQAVGQRGTDPDNLTYWRMNSRRMEAQLVRDSLLALAGDLDPTLGGPPLPAKSEHRRRSLYYFHSHNEENKFLTLFDDANVLECYRRSNSIVPQQALALQNSRLALHAAQRLTARLDTPERANDEAFVRAAYSLLLAQTPTSAEVQECQAALAELHALAEKEKRPQPHRFARTALIHALLNLHDFLTIR